MFDGLKMMKRSAVLLNLIRAVFVVLAYKELAHPKSAIIPPGTGRTTAYYIKSCFQIGKSYLKTTVSRMKRAGKAKRFAV